MEFSEQDFLDLCKANIEEKFHLGNGDRRLKQRDFEYLIDLIEETSSTKLSVSTLKRLWRETSEQNPHPSTLNALVSILGYKDWLDFKVQNAPKREPTKAEVTGAYIADDVTKSASEPAKKINPVLLGGLVVVLLIVVLVALSVPSQDTETTSDAMDVHFSVSNTVSTGVPNTVIFNYDVQAVQADTFFIQRDWNPNNIDVIDPSSSYFTSIYYLPGFHRARLLADDSVLRTEEVFIRTDGWLPAAMYSFEAPPVYLEADSSQGGMLSIREDNLFENQVDMDRLGGIFLFNIGDFGDLDGHNFKSETRFRLRELATLPCPGMQFTIHTEANIYYVQLAPMGCVGDVDLFIGGTFISGGNNDLSAFGTDVTDWQELSLTVEDKHATVFLNGDNIYELDFEQDFGSVVGVDYRFMGLGDVDYLRLSRIDDTTVYEENF